MSKPIHQEVMINAEPSRVYSALLDGQQFAEMSSGAPAQIDATEGSAFSLFGGAIQGRNIELVQDKLIVQAWRVTAGDAIWDSGVYSIVRIELVHEGSNTKLIFDHDGFPDASRDHLEPGWHKMYWEPLQKYLA